MCNILLKDYLFLLDLEIASTSFAFCKLIQQIRNMYMTSKTFLKWKWSFWKRLTITWWFTILTVHCHSKLFFLGQKISLYPYWLKCSQIIISGVVCHWSHVLSRGWDDLMDMRFCRWESRIGSFYPHFPMNWHGPDRSQKVVRQLLKWACAHLKGNI